MEKLALRKKDAIDSLKFLKNELDDFVMMHPNDQYYERTRNSVIHSFEFATSIPNKVEIVDIHEVSKEMLDQIKKGSVLWKS